EFDGSLFGHPDALQRLGVLRDAGCPNLAFENPEIPELQAIAVAEFLNDFIKKVLNDAFDVDPLITRSVGDSIDQLFFCDGFHFGTRGRGFSSEEQRRMSGYARGASLKLT